MPVINLENDSSVFQVTTKKGKVVNIDVMELSSALIAAGVSEGSNDADSMKKIAETAKAIAWPADAVAELSEHELFALASKVLVEYKRLGNG